MTILSNERRNKNGKYTLNIFSVKNKEDKDNGNTEIDVDERL